MITKNNFKDLLKTLGFTAEGNIFQKSIGEAELKVDFKQQLIFYPIDKGLKVNRRDTCNFSQNENFVVFECVHRLLEKGYKPTHLELEPTWRIGHGASGGRADVLVKDQELNSLVIIECKTAGDEFERAWEKIRQDGGQLFTYAHQDAQTQYICLYASSFIHNKLDFKYKLIPHLDNPQILAEDKALLSFEGANKAEQRFAVWRDTYRLEYTEVGIFEDNIQPYQIGKNNYTLAEDTKAINTSDKDGKYHDFRTILRKHNIARRENAFEVLVNLFLCKLVDEEENENNLQFFWNGPASDNYFDFVDRLQNLYQKGMRKFLNEEISYISTGQIDEAFWPVKNDRNATKKQIQAYFKELKFFSNSAFSFLDTHNEGLFNRNTAVLSEVVKMWQGLRLKTDEQNQFLGDMFELFLDDGIKQSEGQFFTPLPICKFIVGSLPLAQKIATNPEPIKVTDFACGSGHFLNEIAHQIKPLVEEQNSNPNDYYSQITGIEKEDRLAKVAKVAAYMHGQEQICILDADALASHPEIPLASFDVLVANPPFSVEGFLQTVSDLDKEQYQLMQRINKGKNHNTKNIECFFLERIHHLMAPGGVVGVIVPASILSNADGVHTGTREILLQYFDLVSIAELGQGAFGKTGTNTVVLFLRRRAKTPEPAEHYRNRVDDFFHGDFENAEYQDSHLIKAYCEHIEVPYEDYIKLFAPTNLERLSSLLQSNNIFQDYQQAFSESRQTKNLKKSNVFKKKTATEQSAELEQRFVAYLHNIEKNKLYYFILAHDQAGKVLIVNAPNDKEELDHFLGYKWSSAKGREGIKYNGGGTVNDIVTPLFNPKDLENDAKINSAIKRNYIGETTDPLPAYCRYAKLTEMLDFNRPKFNKSISLNPMRNIEIETQWPLVRLGDVAETQYGYTANAGDEGDVRYLRITDITEDGQLKNTNKKYINPSQEIIDDFTLESNDIVIARSGSTGRMLLYKDINEHLIFASYLVRLEVSEKLLPEYIFAFHKTTVYWKQVDALTTTLAQPNLNAERMKQIKIPLPPLQIQRKIVDECEVIDRETYEDRQTITAVKQQIEEKVNLLWSEGKIDKLDNVIWINTKTYNPTLKPDEEFIYIDIDSVGKGNGVVAYSKRLTGRNAPSRARRIAKNGNTIISTVRPYLKGFAFVDTHDIDDCVYSTGFAVLESKNPYSLLGKVIYYFFMYMDQMMQQMINTMEKSSYPSINEDDMKNYQFPIPPLHIQQQLVAEVEQLEAEITYAQAVINKAAEHKNAILKKHL